MKKFILMAVAALISCATAFAQSNTQLTPEAEARCTELTRKMARELRLNEPEYIKLKALNRERMARTDMAMRQYSDDERLLKQQLTKIASAYEQQLITFLKPDQLQAYGNYKENANKVRFVAAGEEY